MDRFLTRSNSVGKRPLEGPIKTSEWKIPKRTARQAEHNLPEPIKTSNSFGNLPDNQSSAANCSARFRDAATKKTARIPPIVLDIEPTWTHEFIRTTISSHSKNFHLQYRRNNRVAVNCHTPESHQAIKDGLRTQDIAFHTYSRKDEKLFKAVIFGLPNYVEDGLSAEIASLGFENVIVRKMKVPAEKSSYCPPFLVQLPPGADFAKFRQIRLLCNTVVQIRKYRSNNRYGTQCYRCQGFGHSSANCNLAPRCVKCTDPHLTEECPKKTRDQPAKCCNCGGNHPANFRQCKERENYLKILRERQDQLKAARTMKPPLKNNVVDGRPWNFVAAPNTQKATVADNAQDPATADMLAILMTIKTIKSQFLGYTNMMDKVILILTHLGKYV